MIDGRLTTGELDDRLGVLYTSQTRAQARSALVGLPPLAPSGGEQHEPVRVLPEWVNAPEVVALQAPPSVAASRPTGGGALPAPTDGEMNTAYRRWQAKAEKMKADKAAHEQAEASGDSREAALAVRLKMSRGEEKSARAKYDQLRKRRPDWNAGEREASDLPHPHAHAPPRRARDSRGHATCWAPSSSTSHSSASLHCRRTRILKSTRPVLHRAETGAHRHRATVPDRRHIGCDFASSALAVCRAEAAASIRSGRPAWCRTWVRVVAMARATSTLTLGYGAEGATTQGRPGEDRVSRERSRG